MKTVGVVVLEVGAALVFFGAAFASIPLCLFSKRFRNWANEFVSEADV